MSRHARTAEVLSGGPLSTVQDLGRPGFAHLGVPRAGPLDRPAAALAHRLVGNPPTAALLEVTLGGLALRLDAATWVAVTGAAAPVSIDDRPCALARAVLVPAGGVLRVGSPRSGVRTYVALAGGIDVEPVLGSRATDTLAGVGPPALAPGQVLPLGRPSGPPATVEALGPSPAGTPTGTLRVHPGPRAERLGPRTLARLCAAAYVVAGESNRVGLRLVGPPMARAETGELASEGMVLGAVQVPPSGLPVVFLADHPPTGGYPVVAVVDAADLWQCAQLRPGDPVRFTPAR
ncbi:KipI antagonist [Nocardioides dokdonensis FR1436]|uniref:KipI antagonist n=1 Tax=Nocardioides dokdonensis FR1436 TaxID=1300347 RepID=A0A1A9GP29_9ACTN|nr:biotin-dependent carboxyltransferase family protein [Nocardioides dokdonensis]ANH40048.1 KipI antagonist [Nocardioides dokdonensis FR1436]